MNPLAAGTLFLVLTCLLSGPVLALDQVPARAAPSTQPRPSQLNSERIRAQFGSYGIDILQQDMQTRVSSLYSMDQGQKITRTLAVVMYADEIPSPILAEHQIIAGGGSIGEVFKANGWSVEKKSRYFGALPASPDYAEIYALMGGIQPMELATHVYELSVCKAGRCLVYATIAEVHHPDYFDQALLEETWNAGNILPEPGQTEARDLMNAVQQQLIGMARQHSGR